jgi:MFS family permease
MTEQAVESEYAKELTYYRTSTEKGMDDIRNVAKWIVGGVMATAGGVIAGASLTSMGSLGWEWRLQLAVGAAVTGFVLLGLLMWFALGVITPRSYSLKDIAAHVDITKSDWKIVEKRVRDLYPAGVRGLHQLVTDATAAYVAAAKGDATQEEKQLAADYGVIERFIVASTKYEHLLLLFKRLRNRVFVLVPLIALSIGVFAWAANPPKAAESGVPGKNAALGLSKAD